MSETVKRILSGSIISIVTILMLIFYDFFYWIFPLLFLGTLCVLGVLEFYRLVDRGADGGPHQKVGIFFTVLVVLAFYFQMMSFQAQIRPDELPDIISGLMIIFYPEATIVYQLIILALFATLISHLLNRPLDGTIYSTATTVFGIFYVVVPVSHSFLYMTSDRGIFYLIFVVLGTTMTDIGAYFVGKYMGRHNAGLKVSPKKTYEGYAGGLVFAAISLVLFVKFVPGIMGLDHAESFPGVLETVIVSLFISIASIAGDLSESAIKRDAKKKDSASLIPGHGGFLDLSDALFFTVPLFYYYLTMRESLGISV